MSPRTLEARINGELVGHLREADDIWEFEYADTWRDSATGFDLSPTLSRSTKLHRDGSTNRSVQWYFDNLLPEDAMRTLVAKEAGVDAADGFALLVHYGRESAGSIVLTSQADNTQSATGLKPLPRGELSRRIEGMLRVSLVSGAPKKMSLAGAQHKLLVVLKEGELYEPLAGTPSTHILKPDHVSSDYPGSVANEYFTMRLARGVGLDVPDVRRLYVPQPIYIVERFDRVAPQSGSGATRLHAIDACQLLNKSRSFKYSAADVNALASAIELCREKAGARIAIYRWLAFNLLVGNGDNHLKNISFMVDAGGVRIAKFYDLLSTAVYETSAIADELARWPQTGLALAIGQARTFGAIRREDLLAAGDAIGLNRTTTIRELNRLIELLPKVAGRLADEIEQEGDAALAESPDPEKSRMYIAGELRLIRAINHVVIRTMADALSVP